MGNCNNCMVPSNSMTNQYITRNCGFNFTSDNYNEHLAKGKMSK